MLPTMYLCTKTSSSLDDDQFARVVEATHAWYVEDFCPAWERLPGAVIIAGATIQTGGSRIVPCALRDALPGDPSDALAYHWVNPVSGEGEIVVLVDRILGPLTDLSDVAQALQHEVGEDAEDHDTTRWSDRGDGTEEPLEAVDRVQGTSYHKTIKRSDGTTFDCKCTDFLLPEAFNLSPPLGAKFDFCGVLKSPREIGPGGYTVVRKAGSNDTTVFGNIRNALAYSRAALTRHGVLATRS